jgi:glutamine---fructose-6-phosphate transaminase (isomerizing)
MLALGERTRDEILSQTIGWRQALEVVEKEASALIAAAPNPTGRPVVFTGCGSTYYLGLAAAAHLSELTGWPTVGAPASELWLAGSYWGPDDMLIAVSRSGSTSETLFAADTFHSVTGRWPITIQCVPDAPLQSKGSIKLIIPAAAEKSVAQTRSFTSMFVAAESMNAVWAKRNDIRDALAELPKAGQRLLEVAVPFARTWGPRLDLDRIYFLGSGIRYGLACEASLKMKEMTLSHSEPFHFLEFRHGPKSMVTETALIVGLVSDHNREHELRVLNEMSNLGASVITLGEHVEPIGRGVSLSFDSEIAENARGVLYLPPLQLLALERAVAKGLDPDLPRNLDAVVHLDRQVAA